MTGIERNAIVAALKLGIEPSPSTPEGFRDILRREIPIWHKVAKQANIRIE